MSGRAKRYAGLTPAMRLFRTCSGVRPARAGACGDAGVGVFWGAVTLAGEGRRGRPGPSVERVAPRLKIEPAARVRAAVLTQVPASAGAA